MIRPGGLLLVIPTPICTHHNDSSRWFAISSPPHLICCPTSFSLLGGELQKGYITKLGCENYFTRVTYWAPLEMHIIIVLVGTCDLRTLWSPLVSLNLVHVLVFFRNFYPARLQEFFLLLLLFHHLLHPGMRNLDDGTDGWKGRPSADKTKAII